MTTANQYQQPSDKYQQQAATTAIYGHQHAVIYPALGLAAEAGEVANKVKKIMRDGELDREGIADEIGDCLWYIANIASDIGYSLEEIADMNLTKLQDRQHRNKLSGSGDFR